MISVFYNTAAEIFDNIMIQFWKTPKRNNFYLL